MSIDSPPCSTPSPRPTSSWTPTLDDGIAWLRGAVAEHVHLPLEQLCDAILAELRGTVEDDVALLALRAHPEDRPRPPGL